MLEALRQVTRLEVEIASSSSPRSKSLGFVHVFPLQTVHINIRASLTVPVAEVNSHTKLKLFSSEMGDNDPLEAWKRAMAVLSVYPVISTTTDEAEGAANPGPEKSSDNILTPQTNASLATASAAILEDYPVSMEHEHCMSNFGYLSLSSPPLSTSTTTSLNSNTINLSFSSPPGTVIAKAPGTSYKHAVAARNVAGTISETSSHVAYTYTLTLTIPNVANGLGCIALRLALGRNPLLAVSRSSTSSSSSIIPVPSGSLFLATMVHRIRVATALAVECFSRQVSPNRVHIQVTLSNVSNRNLFVENVDFDVLSTRLGQFKDSLDTVDPSPEHRLAPKAFDDDDIVFLRSCLMVLPLTLGELKPHLQPLEMFCVQFTVQLKPHLSHVLVADRKSTKFPNGLPAKSKLASSAVANKAVDAFDASSESDARLERLLRNSFITAVHVQYQSDAWEDPSAVFRAERYVKWSLVS